jgi:FkbM family methyltransferase
MFATANATWRSIERFRFGIRNRLSRKVRATDGRHELLFVCESELEVWRAQTLRTKEAGTVRWIQENVQPGDVFYDIGANIGLYSMLAAAYVGEQGKVFAFEPHLPNAVSLMRNALANRFQSRLSLVTTALHSEECFLPFNYCATIAGSSMSQLNGTETDLGESFTPVFSELKHATSIDLLVKHGDLPEADIIKIDVDGNEPHILAGMRELLLRGRRPRSVQVEVSPKAATQIEQILNECRYERIGRHDTANGLKKLANGVAPDSMAYNAVYAPRLP